MIILYECKEILAEEKELSINKNKEEPGWERIRNKNPALDKLRNVELSVRGPLDTAVEMAWSEKQQKQKLI